jgi:hypothetical protein
VDSFEYLIALVSVIAGLGITRALSGMARLLDARRKIAISWIPICWTLNVLLWLVAFWWFTFLLSSFEGWSPWLHVFVLVYAGAIFFLLALLHPESLEEGSDMLEHFLDNRRMFFGALLIVALIDVADTWIKSLIGLSAPPLMQYSALMLPWITMSTIAMFVRNRTYHAVFALMFFGTIVLWLTYSINGILAIVSGDA